MKYLKILILFLVIYILACCTIYFSMSEYENTQSASCLSCSYIRDVLLFSLFSTLITSILYYIFKKILKKEKYISMVTVLVYCIVVFFSNYYIFVDRVSSWSSFTFSGELMGIVSHSYIYLIFTSIFLYLFLKKLQQKI